MNGKFDAELDQLTALLQRRKELVGQQLLVTLKPGDTVVFNGRTRPTYLRGQVGTIQRVENGKAYVVLPRDIRKYRAGVPIGTPATLVNRI